MSRAQFDPVTMYVPVTFTDIEIGPYPTVVHSVLGRGSWPHHNIVFEFRGLSIYRLFETKLASTYASIDAYLQQDLWGRK